MNLSDHSESIHLQIKKLQELTKHLQVQDGFRIEDWLRSLGITRWLKSLIMMFAGPVLIILFFLLLRPCILQCIMSHIYTITDAFFEKRGGDVGAYRNIDTTYAKL